MQEIYFFNFLFYNRIHKKYIANYMTTEELKNILCTTFNTQQVQVTGENNHFDLIIVTDGFVGKNTLQRSKLVYKALNEYIINNTIHAITMKTYTLLEWRDYTKLNGGF